MKRKRTLLKRIQREWLPRAAPPLAAFLLRLLYRTMRVEFTGLERAMERWRRGEPTIFVFWHGRMLLAPMAHRAPPGGRLAVMISTHGDGEAIAGTMRRLGFDLVRGSSTRGGAAAAKASLRVLRGGSDVAITPDGPRGPRHVVQEGAVVLARLSGVPIVPVAFAARPAARLSTWDAFMIPAPFARCAIVFGEPIFVPRDRSEAQAEAARERLEAELRRMTEEADAAILRRERLPAAARPTPLEG